MQAPSFRCLQGCGSKETVVMIPEDERIAHAEWHEQNGSTYSAAFIMAGINEHVDGQPWHLFLSEKDTAWNPASTGSMISGPAQVTYIQWADGGVEARVTPR